MYNINNDLEDWTRNGNGKRTKTHLILLQAYQDILKNEEDSGLVMALTDDLELAILKTL